MCGRLGGLGMVLCLRFRRSGTGLVGSCRAWLWGIEGRMVWGPVDECFAEWGCDGWAVVGWEMRDSCYSY